MASPASSAARLRSEAIVTTPVQSVPSPGSVASESVSFIPRLRKPAGKNVRLWSSVIGGSRCRRTVRVVREEVRVGRFGNRERRSVDPRCGREFVEYPSRSICDRVFVLRGDEPVDTPGHGERLAVDDRRERARVRCPVSRTGGTDASSSAGVPVATIRPSARKAIRSAISAVIGRWLATTIVFPQPVSRGTARGPPGSSRDRAPRSARRTGTAGRRCWRRW